MTKVFEQFFNFNFNKLVCIMCNAKLNVNTSEHKCSSRSVNQHLYIKTAY